MKVDTQTLLELLAVPGLPEDFELKLEVTITKAEIERALAAGSGAPRDLTLVQMADSVDRSLSTVRGWLARGDVPEAYKLNGRDWFCPAEAWTRYLEQRKRKPAAAIAEEDDGGEETEVIPVARARRNPRGLTLDSWREIAAARGGR